MVRLLPASALRYYGKDVIIILDEYDTPMLRHFIMGLCWD